MNRVFFVFGRIILFCSPFILILVFYIFRDPFMVLYHHKDYNEAFYINKNNDFVATEKYIENSKIINYDSFIIGSSTARFFNPTTWKGYIKNYDEVFCFDASSENIVGIWSKIKYINLHNNHIKNALLIFDTDATFMRFENDSPLLMKHYKIYPSSRLNFHYRYFLNFIDFRFLIRFIHYRLTNKYYNYMEGFLLEDYYYYDKITNEYFNVDILNELKSDSINYYLLRKDNFGTRSGKYLENVSQITQEHIFMLFDIRNIFRQDSTDFRIIIGPAFNQIAFNREDKRIIQTIFGQQNVFDFSGINEFSEKQSNFYDEFHFKKYVAKEILDIAYGEK